MSCINFARFIFELRSFCKLHQDALIPVYDDLGFPEILAKFSAMIIFGEKHVICIERFAVGFS